MLHHRAVHRLHRSEQEVPPAHHKHRTVTKLPTLKEIHHIGCKCITDNINNDTTYPGHRFVTLLPPGMRFSLVQLVCPLWAHELDEEQLLHHSRLTTEHTSVTELLTELQNPTGLGTSVHCSLTPYSTLPTLYILYIY